MGSTLARNRTPIVSYYLRMEQFIDVYHFVLFHLAIVLSVLRLFADSDCLFGIFKLFLSKCNGEHNLCLYCCNYTI